MDRAVDVEGGVGETCAVALTLVETVGCEEGEGRPLSERVGDVELEWEG